MKTSKYFLSLCAICCAMVSCTGNSPEEPGQKELRELREKALELATCLTDNYTVGDSLFFETETGEKEGFVVETNSFMELKEMIEAEGGGEEEGEDEGEEKFTVYVSGYKISTNLQSQDTHIQVLLFCVLENGKTSIDGTVVLNKKPDMDISRTTVEDDTVEIMIADKSCILQKNTGIVKVQGNRHSWELIR